MVRKKQLKTNLPLGDHPCLWKKGIFKMNTQQKESINQIVDGLNSGNSPNFSVAEVRQKLTRLRCKYFQCLEQIRSEESAGLVPTTPTWLYFQQLNFLQGHQEQPSKTEPIKRAHLTTPPIRPWPIVKKNERKDAKSDWDDASLSTIIREYHSREHLWCTSSAEYLFNNYKRALEYAQIAEVINNSGTEFTGKRELAKEDRGEENSGGNSEWKYYADLQFLKPYLECSPAPKKRVKKELSNTLSDSPSPSKKYIILLIVFIIFLFTGMYVLLAVTQAGECCRKMEQKLETMQRSIVFPQMLTLNHPDGAFDLKTDNLNEAIENAHATNKQQTATTPASKKPKSSRITIINQLVKSSSKSEESVNRCQSLLNQYRRLKRRPAPRRFHRYPMVSQLRLACDDACSANCEISSVPLFYPTFHATLDHLKNQTFLLCLLT
uniref:MADF domain-containing protein n=1 Tax=Ditylenchus dipsaci TaxID=166011 RepID=A0A915E5F9_9BILA